MPGSIDLPVWEIILTVAALVALGVALYFMVD